MDASTLSVATLTLRVPVRDQPSVRLRAARELQAADLTPAGLPPASVLVVRHLADPLPGRFGGGRVRPRPDWERAVRDALDTVARTAVRPDERGRLAHDAAAVLFEDESQLIACLVIDRAHGRAASRWWWKSVLPRLNLPLAALGTERDPGTILAARPREAPAALALIARWGQAEHVARAFAGDSASVTLRSLAKAHDLPRHAIEPDAGAERRREPLRPPESEEPVERPTPAAASTDVSSAPWIDSVPEEIRRAGLPYEVQRLFGVALCLQAAPARLRARQATAPAPRSSRGPAALAASRPRRVAAATSVAPTAAPPGAAEPERYGTRARTRASRATAANASTSAKQVADGSAGNRIDRDALVDAVDTERTGAQPSLERASVYEAFATRDSAAPDANTAVQGSHPAPPLLAAEHAPSAPPARRQRPRQRRARRVEPADEPMPAATQPPAVFSTEGAATRLGGVFYLIQALKALNLPAAFNPAWHLEATAGPWGTLDLIARALLGKWFPSRDPLWNALALLAAWPGQGRRRNIGAEALSPHAGTADPAWIAPRTWRDELDDPGDRVEWTADGERLWLWSREGYVLAHRRSRGDVEAAARRECRRRATGPAQARPVDLTWRTPGDIPWMLPAALPAGCPARLGRWAAATAPAVLRRLALALESGSTRGRSQSSRLRTVLDTLAVPARLYLTSSHADVVIPLERISLPARRAGLDRNPGWLPAYGRVVYFHFE